MKSTERILQTKHIQPKLVFPLPTEDDIQEVGFRGDLIAFVEQSLKLRACTLDDMKHWRQQFVSVLRSMSFRNGIPHSRKRRILALDQRMGKIINDFSKEEKDYPVVTAAMLMSRNADAVFWKFNVNSNLFSCEIGNEVFTYQPDQLVQLDMNGAADWINKNVPADFLQLFRSGIGSTGALSLEELQLLLPPNYAIIGHTIFEHPSTPGVHGFGIKWDATKHESKEEK